MMLIHNTPNHRTHGFTLLEVMIALMVTSIGLLGLAALQANSMRFNQTAYLRGQAALLAYDMADRMRANKAGIDAGDYNAPPGTIADPGCITTTTGCTPAEMAQYDFFQWQQLLGRYLPGSAASTYAVDGTNANRFNITVAWREQTGNENDNGQRSFTLEIEP